MNNVQGLIRAARKKAGLTIAQAARRNFPPVSPRLWAHWEKGEYLPAFEFEAITVERVIATLAGKGRSRVRHYEETEG